MTEKLSITVEYDIDEMQDGRIRVTKTNGLTFGVFNDREHALQQMTSYLSTKHVNVISSHTYVPHVLPKCGNDTRGWSPSFGEGCELEDGACIHCKWEIPF